ncbi:hypothetical protein BP422_19765 [Brevibacillus formosus]|uniref:Uncharacterized protein n=1 Tax=Brevibacillus formosus TaxID=54913 RepID=A0A220MKK2_9BACL|nr:hypothetical protein [Brevibacillus formosus]ASJ55587.1 hypothetical protein BP422_19765 [Brevibacillus formosus]
MKKVLFSGAMAIVMAASAITPAFAASQDRAIQEAQAQATWDGSFSNSYTIPKSSIIAAVAGGTATIAKLLEKRGVPTEWTAPIAAAISAGVGSSVTGDIKVSGTTYYKWIKFPTKAFYRVETTIKMGNTVIDEDVIEYEADANHGGDVAPK